MSLPEEIIAQKRDGRALSHEEIRFWIEGVVSGDFLDYQSAALLMAIFLKGMDAEETAFLTEEMMHSGEVISLDEISLPKVDKHSTGGVGDKVSLILAPLAASVGLCVPMISGRGLGHTGGTLDKLESIPGFRTDLTIRSYRRQLESLGVAMVGQTEDFVPADKKLYALRDVTATVESLPLICASIMSKKLAEGIDSLVLDVKFGKGAFMKQKDDAIALAEAMVAIGRKMGKPTRAILTAMDQPLGCSVGNALEVIEVIECLQGRGPADVMEVTMTLTAHMMICAGVVNNLNEAFPFLQEKISSGAALDKFREIIKEQGGDEGVIDDYSRFPLAEHIVEVRAVQSGYVNEVNALEVGIISLKLGAGRSSIEESIDPAVGVSDLVKVGSKIEEGEVICRLHGNDGCFLAVVSEEIQSAFVIGEERKALLPLIHGVVIGESFD
ncbi:MAG: thymidine phosphorylase [Opitutaceae bacterium]|nr:thymidine phosphorylase [Opitutaceae bacterium]